MKGEEAIKVMVESLAAEGVDPSNLAGVESKLRRWLYKAQRIKAAHDLFSTSTIDVVVERLGIPRSTAYHMYHRYRENKFQLRDQDWTAA
jgi:hypothetical protein